MNLARIGILALAWFFATPSAKAQGTPLLLKETISREYSIHVGGVQTPEYKDVVSRELSVFIGAEPEPPYKKAISREVSLVVTTPAVPARITQLMVTPTPTGETATLSWNGYNQWAELDVARYDIYLSTQFFTNVAQMTPYTNVPGETLSITLNGFAPWQDRFFAVVPVDAAGGFDPAVNAAAAYTIAREVISRELSVFIGAEPEPPFKEAISREVSLVVTTPAVPARVTQLVVTPTPTGDTATLSWNGYNQWAELDVARYDIYLSAQFFTNVAQMTPYTNVPGETLSITLNGFAPWQDRFFAVVPVDAAGGFDRTVNAAAAYTIAREVISREMSVFIGAEPEPPYQEVISREVSVVVATSAVPAPVTGLNSGFVAATSSTTYRAIELDWSPYNEVAQGDIVRYRIYAGPAYYEDVSGMEPYEYFYAGTTHWTLTGLDPSGIYYLAVVAEDVLGQINPVVRAMSAQASVGALGEVRSLAVASGTNRLRFTWLRPDGADSFLAAYRVYLAGATVPVVLDRAATSYEAVDLLPAHGYPVLITTVDKIGNESAGTSLLAATLLDNPINLAVNSGFDAMVRLAWDHVEPNELVSHYAVYVAGTKFSSVAGMTPVLQTGAQVADIQGLTNGTKYYFAVTTINISGGERMEVVTTNGIPTPGQIKWAFATGGYIESSPAIGIDGTVYVGSDDHNVYALDGAMGAKKWSFATGGVVHSSPAIGLDGTVYVGSDDYNVYALDGATGARKWSFHTGKFVTSSPALGSDGTVYVGSGDNSVYALDGATGARKWSFATGNSIHSSPTIGIDGTVYVGSWDNNVYALDGATGVKKWLFVTGASISSSPALASDGSVYVGSYDSYVYALSGKTGARKWAFHTGTFVTSSPALGSDGTVYVGSWDKSVYALNGATGAQTWVFTTRDNVSSSPAIGSDGTVYVGSNDGKVYALDGATGVQKWSFDTGYVIDSSPAIGSDGTVYVGCGNQLYAFQGTAGLANSTWPKFHHDNRNTGRSQAGGLPFLTQAPQGQTNQLGDTIELTVQAASDTPMSYQWFKAGVPLVEGGRLLGTQSAQLTIANACVGDAGDYTVTVSNLAGPATSGAARVVVLDPPYIVTPPLSQSVVAGSNATLGVEAYGQAPLLYQWTKATQDIPEATNAWLELSPVKSTDAGQYAVRISNPSGTVTSAPVLLTVVSGPGIVTGPISQTVALDTTVTFTATADGTGPLNYQWRKNGVVLEGETNVTLVLPNVQLADAGSYDVVVQNPWGTFASPPAQLQFILEALDLRPFGQELAVQTGAAGIGTFNNRTNVNQAGEPPILPDHRGGHSVWLTWVAPAKGIATFRTVGSSFDTLLGVFTNVSSATSVPLAADDDGGGYLTSQVTFNAQAGVHYYVAVDGFNDVTGDGILSWQLEMTSAVLPEIVSGPVSKLAYRTEVVRFGVVLTETLGVSYQWYFNGQPQAGRTGPEWTLGAVGPAQVGTYQVAVTNSAGRGVRSAVAVLEIIAGAGELSVDKLGELPGSLGKVHSMQAGGAGVLRLGLPGNHWLRVLNSTTEQGEPIPREDIPEATRWVDLEAETNGVMVLDTQGSEVAAGLAVYTGPLDYSELTPVEAAETSLGGGQIQQQIQVSQGVVYHIQIYGMEAAGLLQLNYALHLAPQLAGRGATLPALAGERIELRVAVEGSPPLWLQWYKRERLLAGETNAALVFPAVGIEQAGEYAVKVWNTAGAGWWHYALQVDEWLRLNWTLRTPPDQVMTLRVPGYGEKPVYLEMTEDWRGWTRVLTNPPDGGVLEYPVLDALRQTNRFYQLKR